MKKTCGDIIIYTCVTKMTIIWCMVPEISSTTDRIFCHLDHFFPFYPLSNLKNQNFEKMQKMPWEIIILHICNINDNHMVYGSWDMKRDRQNFLSFWTNFCTFNSLKTWKIQILKKWSNCLEILLFYTFAP